MKYANLEEAIMEAERFLSKARLLRKRTKVWHASPYCGRKDYCSDGPEAAACKRASLDLTKILARLRHE